MFESLDIAASGVGLAQTWLDTIAHNLANVNTVRPPGEEPFRADLVWAEENVEGPGYNGSGVRVRRFVDQEGAPMRVYDPTHPLADEDGIVTLPVVDMAGQMADLIVAQRSYQLNLRVIETSREAYETALRIGR
ncbi:MAG TPA: flagellar basal body rod protein FlgC [Actinobacteria bacterium]|nr:flagellar basal body rod protein FlgC [Actinomycetota bacterium]